MILWTVHYTEFTVKQNIMSWILVVNTITQYTSTCPLVDTYGEVNDGLWFVTFFFMLFITHSAFCPSVTHWLVFGFELWLSDYAGCSMSVRACVTHSRTRPTSMLSIIVNTSLVSRHSVTRATCLTSRNEIMEITILRNTNDVERKVQTDVFPLDPMSQLSCVSIFKWCIRQDSRF